MVDKFIVGDFKSNVIELEARKKMTNDLMFTYPERFPVIVEKTKSSKELILRKSKYLAPKEITWQRFIFEIRKNISLESYEASFIFVNGKMPNNLDLLDDVYFKHKDDDGFLYVVITTENTFGAK